jgi:predicted membrane-bound spermidine synthase
VKPAADLVLDRDSIDIFDMFFGLGYNSICALYYLREVRKYAGSIHITGIELDSEIMSFAKDIFFDSSINTKMLSDAGIVIDTKKFNELYSKIRTQVDIINADALVEVKKIKKKFDIA